MHVKVNDWVAFAPHKERAWVLVGPFHGKWIVCSPQGGDFVEGANGIASYGTTVAVEFDSFEQAKACY